MGSRGSFKSFLTRTDHWCGSVDRRADGILGHGDNKKSLQALYLNISDQQILDAIDIMKFDTGETVVKAKK